MRCPGCGRIVPEAKLHRLDEALLCGRCFRERSQQVRREQVKQTAETTHQRRERLKLKILLGIFAVLLLLVMLSWLGVIGRR